MQELSAEGKRIVEDLARRFELSEDAIRTLLSAVSAGGGTMAQFNHPELGGMGQWSAGGMIMIADMFNNGLKHRVSMLCDELAMHVSKQAQSSSMSESSQQFQSQSSSESGMKSQAQSADASTAGAKPAASAAQGVSLFVAAGGRETQGQWWPAQLGTPSSSGFQNDLRYAYFPEIRRLAILLDGKVTVYDTAEHLIKGFSQAQSSDQSITFMSQLGLVRVADLARV